MYRMLLHYLCGLQTHSIHGDYLFDSIGLSETTGHQTIGAHQIAGMAVDGELHFIKTHAPQDDPFPAVHIIRDGRDTLVSAAHYAIDFQTAGLEFPAMLRSLILAEYAPFGHWSDKQMWWAERNAPTVTVRFEDMMADPVGELRRSLEALGLGLKLDGNLPAFTFNDLHEKWPNFFRRGSIGGWRDEMGADLEALFWQHHAPAMNHFGYERN